MGFVIIGGIFMAAHLPARPPLGPAVGLLACAAVLVLVNCAQLARLREFAWGPFLLVAKWSLAAYLVITGMFEYVFVLDGTRGSPLVVVTLMLAVFAFDIPMLLGFSVAKYQTVAEQPMARGQ
jgi:peptidoglycan/LPS O-acetylase OafA/YrhL